MVAAAKLRLARLPAGVTKAQLYGGAVLCGIGFTMSLFIGDLAFRQTPRGDEVKLAVFVARSVPRCWGWRSWRSSRGLRGDRTPGGSG